MRGYVSLLVTFANNSLRPPILILDVDARMKSLGVNDGSPPRWTRGNIHCSVNFGLVNISAIGLSIEFIYNTAVWQGFLVSDRTGIGR